MTIVAIFIQIKFQIFQITEDRLKHNLFDPLILIKKCLLITLKKLNYFCSGSGKLGAQQDYGQHLEVVHGQQEEQRPLGKLVSSSSHCAIAYL